VLTAGSVYRTVARLHGSYAFLQCSLDPWLSSVFVLFAAQSSRKGKVATANRSCDSGAESAKEQQAPPSSRKAKKAAAGKKDEDKEEAAAGKDAAAGAKKKLKKLKLEVHEGLPFVDGREICVWVYDPTSFKTFAGGLLLSK